MALRQKLSLFHAKVRRRRTAHLPMATLSASEVLEVRQLLTAQVWDAPTEVTFSVAPDGTEISGKLSSFHAAFAGVGTPEELNAVIFEAFQTWTQHANVNVGRVSDAGQAFGVPGPAQHDDRFGDIRIGAIPMSSEVLAVSVPHDGLTAGTWGGDIVLNSEFQPESLQQFRAVVLHEVGHVLGLEHSLDPQSVMYAHNDPTISQQPTADDIANLVALYGQRIGAEDAARPNDAINRATSMRDGSFEGTYPLVRYGDVSTDSDIDYFRLDPVDLYNGPVTVHLITDGVSLLQGKLTVVDRGGNLIATATASQPGGDVTISLPTLGDKRCYLRVEGAAPEFATGRYLLVAVFDGVSTVGIEAIGPEAKRDLSFLTTDAVGELLTSQQLPVFEDDLHLNDTLGTATTLQTIPGRVEFTAYEYHATISDQTDADFYRIRSPRAEVGASVLTVTVRVSERQTLIPDLQVLNAAGTVLRSQVIANGGGLYTIQVTGIVSDRRYFIRVGGAENSARYRTGNYELSAAFGTTEVQQFEFLNGRVSAESSERYMEMDLQLTTLVSYALKTEFVSPPTSPVATQLTLFNADGEELLRIVNLDETTRTANAVLLPAGHYFVRIASTTPDGSPIPLVRFRLLGRAISDEVGPMGTSPIDVPPPQVPESEYQFYMSYTPPVTQPPDPLVPQQQNQDPWTYVPTPLDPFIDYEDWYWQFL
ncbi:MAG: matrixin family metalloprotease [Planctomycetaceae bacterium]